MNGQELDQLLEPYDTIIFDYGGVFVDIEYQKTIDAFEKLAPGKSANIYSKAAQLSLFDDIEVGAISTDEFLHGLCDILDLSPVMANEVAQAWCALLGTIPYERYEYLQGLKKRKQIYLLSNTNKIHIDFLDEAIAENEKLKGFYEVFEKVYLSHEVGMRKPNTDIFEHVISENNLDSRKTLFIDDSPQHVEGALKAGLAGHHLVNANQLIVGNK